LDINWCGIGVKSVKNDFSAFKIRKSKPHLPAIIAKQKSLIFHIPDNQNSPRFVLLY
jgi:hypothetical protein